MSTGRSRTDHAANAASIAFAESMRPYVLEAIASGAKTDRQIAVWLNSKGLRTRMNDCWSISTVMALRMRLGLTSRSTKGTQ